MFRFHTIPDGQAVAVWDQEGRRTIVKGPGRVSLFRKRVEVLKSITANPQEYLIVRHKDGRVEHLRGPGIEWLDPVEHASISVAPAVAISASEAMVIYRQMPGKVERRVLRGPALFVPEPDEWLHEFSWHGTDPGDPRRKVPRALKFTKLRVIPDQTYFDVADVRTADDALLVVQLMIFFELADIGKMLDRTHDPVADFINAVSADVIDFAATRTFEAFKEQTESLSRLETYAQLCKRAALIGYRVDKVVYRGYQANPKLQAMHDGAIEARTRLKLEAETERQAQELADLKLAREQDRAAKRQAMERAEAEQKIQLSRMNHEEVLRQKKEGFRQRVEYLQAVRGLEVDMTQFLTARHHRPDRLIRIDGDRRAQLHLHGRQ